MTISDWSSQVLHSTYTENSVLVVVSPIVVMQPPKFTTYDVQFHKSSGITLQLPDIHLLSKLKKIMTEMEESHQIIAVTEIHTCT